VEPSLQAPLKAPLPLDFASFRRHVLAEPELQKQLSEIHRVEAFILRTVELGRERGFQFVAGDVEAAILAARRSWMERWIA